MVVQFSPEGLLAGIRNAPGPDILGSFRQGQARRKERVTGELVSQVIAQSAGIGQPDILSGSQGGGVSGEPQGGAAPTDETRSEVVRNSTGFAFAKLVDINPEAALKLAPALGIPLNEKDRIKNGFGTIVLSSKLLDLGVPPGEVAEFLGTEASILASQGIDTPRMQELIKGLASGDENEILAQGDALRQMSAIIEKPKKGEAFTLKPGERRFDPSGREIAGVPVPVDVPTALEKAKTSKFLADADKVRFDQGKPRLNNLQRSEVEKNRALTDEIRSKIAGGGQISKLDMSALEEEKKLTLRTNTKQIGVLQQSAASRAASLKTARKFLNSFKKQIFGSGTTRRFLRFVPGVFTNQAQRDEEMDAFAEIAARAKLKAVGEIRPTDADVTGMKRALFGTNRDEGTNITLLTAFIGELEDLDNELAGLRAAKKAGTLADFTGELVTPTETIGFSSALDRDISEQDIQETLNATPGLTREQLLQQLGIQ